MGMSLWNDKKRTMWLLAVLLLGAFLVTSGFSYWVAHSSLSQQVEENTLPLTSDNIYSEIQQDLLKPIFISSLMAHDTFVRDWTLGNEQQPERLIRYLKEIQEKYGTVTSFFVSDVSHNYYHSSGILKQISEADPNDSWYYRTRGLPQSQDYEINIDLDTADRTKTTVFVNNKVFDYDGNFIGVTGVGLEVEKVGALIEHYQKRYNRRVFFVDRQGTVMLHSVDYSGAATLQQTPGLAENAIRILANPSSAFSFTLEGETYFINSRYVPEFQWYLLVEQRGTQGDEQLLTTLWSNLGISLLVTSIVLLTANMTLGRYQRRLEKMASTDKLTGLANRQVFEEQVTRAIPQAHKQHSPLSLLLFDIDHFKRINDQYGHSIGDLVLKSVSLQLQQHFAHAAVVCRWGGEEFIVLLKGTELTEAAAEAELIRRKISEHLLQINKAELVVTISGGIAELQSQETGEQLLNRADKALYQAKENGRNNIVLSH
ncbi:GGDEF domain-containing protein [Shewanella avicenniae]|uniref:diguanylate cyclase n=1 Tax=Shewanella avicenniae TaxID=2814294 RepID=A0ABX7QPX5_9GAMM|nr:sensor domain-containing diguanylate cyclase [Shewanella avicenniae]QSX33528.1 GGDEF domain-containing protein [Shewanella avicenniae]